MVRGQKASDLLAALLPQIQPYLGEGVRIQMTAHRRWVTLQRADVGMEKFGPMWSRVNEEGLPTSGGVSGIPALGPWVPFLPRGLRRRLVARDAVETLLSVGTTEGDDEEPNHHVVARRTADGVFVAFDRPGAPAERVEIGPIGENLLS